MNIIIKQIAVFNEEGSKKRVQFQDGLNIITGDSKTGKSALIEIVDYCLFAKRSSIPKGKITDFASLFVVVFQIEENYLVVGRPSPKASNNNEAYFGIEFSYEKKLRNLQLDYFDHISPKPIKNDVQLDFERHIGMSINKLDNGEEKKIGKLSIRDTVSFLFQHQNLIASKHALFYRFDDFIKRKRIVDAFPVLFGAVDEKFYDLTRRAKILETKIKAEKKIIIALNKRKENEVVNLRDLIQLYYTMLGKTLENDLSLAELKRIGLALPVPQKVIQSQTKLYEELTKFEEELNIKYQERDELEKAISKLYQNEDDSVGYIKELVNIHNLQHSSTDSHSNLNCPLCSQSVVKLNDNISSIENSKKKLIGELKKLGSYNKDNTEIITSFRNSKKELNKEISKIARNIKLLTSESKEFKLALNKRDNLIFQRGVVQTTIKNYLESNKLKIENDDLNLFLVELKEINEQLKKYNVADFYKKSEALLKSNMDRIANKLDFEEELKPINFNFNLKDFIFHHESNGKIRLDEMGSGANWLACHLSIFLSFLHLSSSNKKSLIPSFLFLDQPSQVYFPKTTIKKDLEGEDAIKFDENIEQVKNIFKVINEEIELIFEKTKIKPQVIVLEHANDPSFEQFIIEDWNKNNGEGLI